MNKIMRTGLVVVLMLLGMAGCASLGIGSLPTYELEEKYFNGSSRYFDYQGLRVHYRDSGGNKPVLVLVHGFGASLHTWDQWVSYLHKDYRIIRYVG